jgi:hypothetical protein
MGLDFYTAFTPLMREFARTLHRTAKNADMETLSIIATVWTFCLTLWLAVEMLDRALGQK